MNFIVDPYGLYGTGLLQPLTFNRYENLRTLFSEYEPKPEAVIIGSSRVGCIDPEIVTEITGYRCFNWGVPASEAEIHYAMLKMILDEFHAPVKLVIVGIEPEVLHPTKPIHPQVEVLYDYMKYVPGNSVVGSILARIKRVITADQLKSSVAVLRGTIAGRETGDWMIWREDGFPTGIIDERIPARYSTDREVHLEKQVDIFPETYFILSEFDRLSPERKLYWENFLQLCRERGIRVYAFMPPPHPKILERLRELGAEHLFDETAEYVGRTVREVGGTFRDFSEVESFGGDPDGFQDQVHINPENGEKIIRALLADYQRDDNGG